MKVPDSWYKYCDPKEDEDHAKLEKYIQDHTPEEIQNDQRVWFGTHCGTRWDDMDLFSLMWMRDNMNGYVKELAEHYIEKNF